MTKDALRRYLIHYVRKECEKEGVQLVLFADKYLRDKYFPLANWVGVFQPIQRRIVVSVGHHRFIETLLHEYAHFLQFKEQCPIWMKLYPKGKKPVHTSFDEWLMGKSVRNIKQKIAIIRDSELDCSIRTVELMKEFGVRNIKSHNKQANAYIHWHNWIMRSRIIDNSWATKPVMKLMSTEFDMDYEDLSPELEKAFQKVSYIF